MRDRKERTISETHSAPSGRNPDLRVGSSSLGLNCQKSKKQKLCNGYVLLPNELLCCLLPIELKYNQDSDLQRSTYN